MLNMLNMLNVEMLNWLILLMLKMFVIMLTGQSMLRKLIMVKAEIKLTLANVI